jgi:hypothetical protein
MYSPTKENLQVRMGINPKKHIIRGKRKIKTIDEVKNHSKNHSLNSK